MSTGSQANPLGSVGNNWSVESGLPYEGGVQDLSFLFNVPVASPGDAEMLEELGLTEANTAQVESTPVDYFPGLSSGDFTEVEQCLARAPSQEDLLAYLDAPDNDSAKAISALDSCLTKESSQVDLLVLAEKPADDAASFSLDACQAIEGASAHVSLFHLPTKINNNSTADASHDPSFDVLLCQMGHPETVAMEVDLEDLMEYVKEAQEKGYPDGFALSVLPSALSGLALSPGTPAEAVDQSATTPQLPSLPVLNLVKQRPQQQQLRSAACPPLLNSFETMLEAADSRDQEYEEEETAASLSAAAATARTGKSKPPAVRRRNTPASSSGGSGRSGRSSVADHQQQEKSYAAICQKNRIFDCSAKLRYQMEQHLERDSIVNEIVQYVKTCLDPERDRVHRFLMVMLVDGQLERGPFWRFFQDAVYFCDSRKERLVSEPGPMFHIRQSAYVGLLWGRYKGNECFDYATLGDAIKSVKSKPNGDRYFVDPDFGSLNGKPKRLFQFGEGAFDEVCRYMTTCRIA